MKHSSFLTAMAWPLVALLFLAALLFVERSGIQYSVSAPGRGFIPPDKVETSKPALDKECLVFYDKEADPMYYREIAFVLDSMSVGYDLCDATAASPRALASYRVVILALTNIDLLKTTVLPVLKWAESGGQLLFAYTPEPLPTLNAISAKLGILNSNDIYYDLQEKVRFATPLLCGGEGLVLDWSGGTQRQGLVVQLSEDCLVHILSINDENNEVPMLWERQLGQGCVVVCNSDAFAQRTSRGLIAAAYSLMGDMFAYPVINASMFFIDDFPAPIPQGYNRYIKGFYNMDNESFYSSIWFRDILGFSRKFHIKFTGLLIETYGGDVDPPFARAQATERFRYYGSVLLQDGGEIGLHGYNHMPLVLPSYAYSELYQEYAKWPNLAYMEEALNEAVAYGGSAFPGLRLKTYVPPSNILSADGRKLLKDRFPQINAISIVYLNDNKENEQEFDVGPDGLINLPRIISGCIFNDSEKWLAMSELNFHYVNSHFLHPDDSLDPERGAEIGWEKLSVNFDAYLSWLYGSARGLRSMTAQQSAAAVQRYCNLSVQRAMKGGRYVLDIGGFYDEAWLLVRINKGKPGTVLGGKLENVCGSLWLLHAAESHVEIALEGDCRP